MLEAFSLPIPDSVLKKFGAERGVSKFNTLWEGLALLVAFRLWLPTIAHGATFRAKSDNLGFLQALARGSAHSAQLNILAREFALDQALRCYRIGGLSHIPGVTNVYADALSRRFSPKPPEWPEALVKVKLVQVNLNDAFWKV